MWSRSNKVHSLPKWISWCQTNPVLVPLDGVILLRDTEWGPMHFTIWQQLHQQDSACIIDHLKAAFFEGSPSAELLSDNNTVFHSNLLKDFLDEWETYLQFCWTYITLRNGIVKRCYLHIKQIATRKLPKDNVSLSTAPTNVIQHYPLTQDKGSPYNLGDHIWVRTPHSQCMEYYATWRICTLL